MAALVTIDDPDDDTSPREPGTEAGRPAPLASLSRMFGCGLLVGAFRRLRREVDDQVRADRERAAERRARRALESAAAGDASESVDLAPPDGDGDGDAEASLGTSELALPDYDHLPASQIVAMLGDLEADERAEIEAYERANRNRRTVLGKLAHLGR